MDLKVPNLDIPTHVKQVCSYTMYNYSHPYHRVLVLTVCLFHSLQVSVGTIITLLRTIAGMQFVLVDHVLSARDSLREYEVKIQNLTFQLVYC